MLMHIFPLSIVFSSLPSLSGYDFATDYAKLTESYYDCGDGCWFDQEEITLKTYQKWPQNCSEVCGILTLNQNSDLSTTQLKALFKGTPLLRGGIRIENTTLTSLAFLPAFDIFSEFIGISIFNNSQLTNADVIIHMEQWDDDWFLRVENNPKLNTTPICEAFSWKDQGQYLIFGNSVDCGCQGGNLTSKNFQSLAKCQNIDGSLTISDLKNKIPSLSNIKIITGLLEVKNTNLKNLSFFENLEELKSQSYIGDPRTIINVHDNPEMTSLGLTALKKLNNKVAGSFLINFKNLHPDFCLTVLEMSVFLEFNVIFSHLEAGYCTDKTWPTDKGKLCVFEEMANLEAGCHNVFGDLLIDSGDEEYVEKLKSVTRVFGSVIVRNTSLENLNFFKNLHRIANLNESLSVIQILYNENLKNLTFPNLQHFITRGDKGNQVIIEGNHANVFEESKDCKKFQYQAKTNVIWDGESCDSMNKTSADNNFQGDSDLPWFYLTVCLLFYS